MYLKWKIHIWVVTEVGSPVKKRKGLTFVKLDNERRSFVRCVICNCYMACYSYSRKFNTFVYTGRPTRATDASTRRNVSWTRLHADQWQWPALHEEILQPVAISKNWTWEFIVSGGRCSLGNCGVTFSSFIMSHNK